MNKTIHELRKSISARTQTIKELHQALETQRQECHLILKYALEELEARGLSKDSYLRVKHGRLDTLVLLDLSVSPKNIGLTPVTITHADILKVD